MTFKISLQLLDNDNSIRDNILSALKPAIDQVLVTSAPKIEDKVKTLLISALQREPEYSSLISGELRREFGIANTSNVDIAISNIVNSTKCSVNRTKVVGNSLYGGILLTIVPKELQGIIDDPSAFVVDTDRGYSLPWLEWLLTRGGQIIVKKFEVKYGSNPRSRSGDAIMVSSTSNWKVPSQFSGTASDNWVTRALSTIEDKILSIIQTELED